MDSQPFQNLEDKELERWVDQQFDTLPQLPLPAGLLSRTIEEINPPQIEPFRISWVEFGFGLLVAAVGTAVLALVFLIVSGQWMVVIDLISQPRLVSTQIDQTRLTLISIVIAMLSLLLLLPSDRSIQQLFQLKVNQS